MSLFVDSSAWYAAVDEDDRFNVRAKEVLSCGEALVTTDHVLVESWLLTRSRLGRRVADRFWAGLRGGIARIEPIGHADLDVAWEIGATFSDQEFSLVDRTCFAAMQRLGIHRAASFDDHFAVFRFGPRLDRAFEVVR